MDNPLNTIPMGAPPKPNTIRVSGVSRGEAKCFGLLSELSIVVSHGLTSFAPGHRVELKTGVRKRTGSSEVHSTALDTYDAAPRTKIGLL